MNSNLNEWTKLKFSSSVTFATVWVPNCHTWLVATILNSTEREYSHHHSKLHGRAMPQTAVRGGRDWVSVARHCNSHDKPRADTEKALSNGCWINTEGWMNQLTNSPHETESQAPPSQQCIEAGFWGETEDKLGDFNIMLELVSPQGGQQGHP